jgi:hypothetical protein
MYKAILALTSLTTVFNSGCDQQQPQLCFVVLLGLLLLTKGPVGNRAYKTTMK